MKKLMTALLAVMLAFSMSACSSGGTTGDGGAATGGRAPVDNSKEVYELENEYSCSSTNLTFEDGVVTQETWTMGADYGDTIVRTGTYTVNKNTVECNYDDGKVTYMLKPYGLVNVTSNYCELSRGGVMALGNPVFINDAQYMDFSAYTEPTAIKGTKITYVADGGFLYTEVYEGMNFYELPKVTLEVILQLEYITNDAAMTAVDWNYPAYSYSRYLTFGEIKEKNADIVKVLETYVDYVEANKDTDIFCKNAYYTGDGYGVRMGLRYDEAIEKLASLYLNQGDAEKCKALWARANYGHRTYDGYEYNEYALAVKNPSGETYTFNDKLLLTEHTERNGVVKHYVYDDEGRLTMSYYTSGSDKTSYQYTYNGDGTVAIYEYIYWRTSGGHMYSTQKYILDEKGIVTSAECTPREQGIPEWAANVPF